MTTRTQQAVFKQRKVKRLCKLAFETVEGRAGEIAEALMDSTKEGKVMSAKLLVDLAEGVVDVEEAVTKRPLRSLALRLANEPEAPQEPLDTLTNAEEKTLEPGRP
jgi:hypothetical protein